MNDVSIKLPRGGMRHPVSSLAKHGGSMSGLPLLTARPCRRAPEPESRPRRKVPGEPSLRLSARVLADFERHSALILPRLLAEEEERRKQERASLRQAGERARLRKEIAKIERAFKRASKSNKAEQVAELTTALRELRQQMAAL